MSHKSLVLPQFTKDKVWQASGLAERQLHGVRRAKGPACSPLALSCVVRLWFTNVIRDLCVLTRKEVCFPQRYLGGFHQVRPQLTPSTFFLQVPVVTVIVLSLPCRAVSVRGAVSAAESELTGICPMARAP